MNIEMQASLFYISGTSDKEYNVYLLQKDDLWICNFSYGRRGSALKNGTKTQSPVSWEKAHDIYNKLVKSKISKGYELQNVHSSLESKISNIEGIELKEKAEINPMLPTAIPHEDVNSYIVNESYIAQQKMDGENRMLYITKDEIIGSNRKGFKTAVRESWKVPKSFTENGDMILCGEDMGNEFIVFDIIKYEGEYLKNHSLEFRFNILRKLILNAPIWMKIVKSANNTRNKMNLFQYIDENNYEGIVFKLKSSLYEEGRSKNILKYKLQESSTFKVIRINDKRSIGLGLYNEYNILEDLGNVTIPANHDIPKLNDLAEVEYLYRFENGALEQPKYKGIRKDIDLGKPGTDQITRIKYKTTELQNYN